MRLVDALQHALRNGPLTQQALMTALDQLGPHPGYIFWLELIALALFFLLALPLHSRPSKARSASA